MIDHELKYKYGIKTVFTTVADSSELFSGNDNDPICGVEDVCFSHYNQFAKCYFTVNVNIGPHGVVMLECLIFHFESGLSRYLNDKK